MSEWTCPRCRQRFVQRSARHSCARQPPAAFFEGRPQAYALYRAVKDLLARFGSVQVTATKSQISFRARTRFAWVWLPQRWLRSFPEEALVLTFDLNRRVRSRKIKQSAEVRPGRWTHHLVLHDRAQLDAEVVRWLRQAYELGCGRSGTSSSSRAAGPSAPG